MKRAIMFAAAALLLTGCGEAGRIFGFERGGPDEFTVVSNPPLSVPPQVTLRPPEEGVARSNREHSNSQARDSLLASGGDSAGSAGTLVTDKGSEPYDGGSLPPLPKAGSSPWYQPQTAAVSPATPGDGQTTATPGNGQTTAGYGAYPQTSTPPTPQYGTPGIPIRYGEQSPPSTGEAALALRVTSYYGVEPDIRRKVNADSAQLALEHEKFLDMVLFWLDPEPVGTALDANAESRRLRENDALGKPVNAGEAPVMARTKSGISSLF